MERLTMSDKKIEGGWSRKIVDERKVREHAMTIYWALKKYEDTGLTPEQILELNGRNTEKDAIITGDNHGIGCKVGI